MSRRFLIFLLVIFSFLTGHLSASTFGFTTKLQGGLQIVPNATLETQDDQYSSMSATGTPGAIWHANNLNQTIKNYIHLKYTGAATIYYSSPWTAKVVLKVERWNEFGAPLPIQTCILAVNYNPASGTKYKDISTFSTTGGAKVKVTVMSFTTGLANLPADVIIENVIEVARIHNMDPRASIYIANTNNHCMVGTGINSANTIEFHWDYLEGAEEYDFEWVFKSTYDQNQTIDFANAARITTTNQYYSINTAFDNGKIYYRVRGIAKDFATGIKRMEGNWTQSTAGVQVCNIEKRNWTYNAVYAEEGKRKEVMTYFDGSTRNRQSVTLSNSENTGLVAEDIYDYEGRPAVKTLPAPSANLRSDLKFYQNFSLNKDHQWYTKKDFDDDDVSACGNGSTPGLNSSPDAASGASDYYSPNNSVLYGFNGAIPDATDYLMTIPENGKSFPFAQTAYSNDGTVKMQSGVGPDFKIGSGHETKYLNATASQEKLDRLFGNEVGYAEHYREKAVIDPNGQVSVSYENLSGKVIATAMRGFSPSNLRELGPDATEEKYMEPEIIHEHFESNYDPASEAYLTLKNFLVTDVNTPYDFKYEITPQQFNTICNQNFKCKYLLRITIVDDCGNFISDLESSTISPSCSLPVLNTIHEIDATNFTNNSFYASFKMFFPKAGVYRIEKRLSLDPSALQAALVNFEETLRDPNGTCITTLSSLNTTYALGVDRTECMSCEEAANWEANHVLYPFQLDQTHTFLLASEYSDYLKSQCTPEIPKKSCDGLLAALKADMSPGGQYFESTVSSYGGTTITPAARFVDALIVRNFLNISNSFPSNFNLSMPDAWSIYNTSNNCSALPSTVNYATVTANWDPCWADFLVQYHPEYCRYKRCVTLNRSYDYDAQLLSINYVQAVIPPNTNTPYLDLNISPIGKSILDNDRYFTSIYYTQTQTQNDYNDMLEEITNCPTCVSQFQISINWPTYPTAPPPPFPVPPLSNSMWDWAAIAPDAIPTGLSPADYNEARWKNFQKLYTAIKAQKFVKNYGCPALIDNSNPPDNMADNVNQAIDIYVYFNGAAINTTIPPAHQQTIQLGGLAINDPEPVINFNTIQTYMSGQAAAGTTTMSPYDQVPCTYTNASAPINLKAIVGSAINSTSFIVKSASVVDPITPLIVPGYSCTMSNFTSCTSLTYPAAVANSYYTLFARIPNVPNNQYWASGTCDIQISNPVLLPVDWTGLPVNTINGYLLQLKNSVDSYISVPYKFTCNITYATSSSSAYSYNIIAPSSLQMNANNIVLKMLRSEYRTCTDCAEIDPAIYCANFGGARQNCVETPITEPHCLCVQLQQAVDLYNAAEGTGAFTSVDHALYPTFAAYAVAIAANLSLATAPTVITKDNVLYWLSKCDQNNSRSPFQLDTEGVVVNASPNTDNSVPEELSCNPYEPCQQQGEDEAAFYASEAFENLVYQHLQDFIIQYKQACLNSANLHEQFNVDYYEKEYHYTLYYYDQAGNLVRTVPPKAVNRLTIAQMYSGLNNENKVQLARLSNGLSTNTFIYPNHNRSNNLLVTNYKYNTLNQLTQQAIPDGGLSNFWYSDIGQMRFSQNAKQLVTSDYSYTIYDGQGRIKEVGQNNLGSTGIFQLNNPVFPTQSGAQVTKTYYDAPIPGNNLLQDFLRKRVASTTYEDIEDVDDLTYNSATHYCYDVHGNVNTLVQDFPDLEINNNRYKTINYKYDLISGNVNEVNYQAGQFDQYYHKYEYDANNRITHAYTSNDNFRWQQDARYFYYLHGPLARVEIGEEKVQGLDYTYTLQGWIKGVNSNNLKGYDVNGNVSDVGTDGYINNYIPGQSNIHGNSARDVFGYSLEYNKNDYRSINPAIAGQVTGGIGNSNLYNASHNLYNGNIKAMITAMYQPNIAGGLPTEMPTMARFFNYDQLNRLKDAQSVTTNFDDLSGLTASLLPAQSDYYESFKFDANGNIRNAKRNGYTFGSYTNGMDDITYNYMSETDNNKLDNVGDIPNNPANFNDIKAGQTSGNYKYDEIGNLTHDEAEGIIDIRWSVYGKIQKIYKASENIEFKYDASGNRIEKIIKPASSGIEKTQEHWTYTYYMRDAQGNVMGIYGREVGIVPGTNTVEDVLFLKETAVYGSSRLGIEEQDYRKSSTPKVQYPYGYNADGTIVGGHPTTMDFHSPAFDHTLGNKKYELSNHLGNVNVVISDRKISENYKYIIPVFGTGNYVFNVDLGIYVYSPTGGPYIRVTGVDNTADNYLADVLSSSDYYAFGMEMPGRTFNPTVYKFGYNGQEKIDEVYEVSGSYLDFTFRGYNTRLGRFFAVDPLTKKYPELTPYQFAGNTPIWARELEGAEPQYSTGGHVQDPFSGETTPGGEKTSLAGPLSESYSQEMGVDTDDKPASMFGKSASVEVMTGSVEKGGGALNRVNSFFESGGRLGGHATIKTNEGVFGFTGGDYLQSTPGRFENGGIVDGMQSVSFPLKDITLAQYNGIIDTYIDRDKFKTNAGRNPTEEGFMYFMKTPNYNYGPLFGYRCASSCLKVLRDNKIVQDTDLKMKFIHAPTPQALIRYLQDKNVDYKINQSSQENSNKYLFNNNFKN